jgi:hypothetical protein
MSGTDLQSMIVELGTYPESTLERTRKLVEQ